jgi:hypothetical protein
MTGHPRRMLPLLAAAAGWFGLAAAAVIIGRAIHRTHRHRPRYVPQLDAPLWRGTDLPDPTRDAQGRHIHGAWCHPAAEGCPDPEGPPCPRS